MKEEMVNYFQVFCKSIINKSLFTKKNFFVTQAGGSMTREQVQN